MDHSRILLIGEAGQKFRASALSVTPNLSEFSAIIWYPKNIINEWNVRGSSWTTDKILEIIAWIKKGNNLVVVGAPPENSKSSFQRGNSRITVDLTKNEIFGDTIFRPVSGSLIEYCGPESLHKNLSPVAQLAFYEAILESKTLVPLFRVSTSLKDENQVVGGYRKIGAGTVVFAPPLHAGYAANAQLAQFFLYHYNLATILEDLKEPAEQERPEWFENFQTLEEKKLKSEISETRNKIQTLETHIVKTQKECFVEQLGKDLFTSTGDAFVNSVTNVLRELGLKVIDGPKQRADLLIWDGKRLGAIEVKGLEGGARERNVGQTNRWTADVSVTLTSHDDERADSEILAYQAKLASLEVPIGYQTEPKGILILNTHRKTAIDERPESFGEPVQKVIVRSGICAMTGLQLFNLVRDVRSGQLDKKTIVDKLFSTTGILDEGLSWQTHLQKKETT